MTRGESEGKGEAFLRGGHVGGGFVIVDARSKGMRPEERRRNLEDVARMGRHHHCSGPPSDTTWRECFSSFPFLFMYVSLDEGLLLCTCLPPFEPFG